jgi:hypothetical protein
MELGFAKQPEQSLGKSEHFGGGGSTEQSGCFPTVQTHCPSTQIPLPEQNLPPLKQGACVGASVGFVGLSVGPSVGAVLLQSGGIKGAIHWQTPSTQNPFPLQKLPPLKQGAVVGGVVGNGVGAPVGPVGTFEGANVGGVGGLVGCPAVVGAEVGVPVGLLVGGGVGGKGQQSVLLNGGALNGSGHLQVPSLVLQITREQQSFGQSFGAVVGAGVGAFEGWPVGASVGQHVDKFLSCTGNPLHLQIPLRLLHIPLPQQFNGQGMTFRLQSQVILKPALSTYSSVGWNPVPSLRYWT